MNNINITDYIGDSLITINANFNSLDNQLQELLTLTKDLSAAFSTRIVGITSIDNCGPYAAFFTESYASDTPVSSLKLSYLYPNQNPFKRKLNTVNYNTTIDGLNTYSANAYYSLDTSTGQVTIPKGVYDINAGCSAAVCNSHTANLITYTTNTPDNKTVLLYGSSEYSPSNIPDANTDVKMRGRVVFQQDNNVVFIKHLVASFDTGYIGYSLGNAQPFKQYWSYLHIQKIKNL
jgi:hypothetical protein